MGRLQQSRGIKQQGVPMCCYSQRALGREPGYPGNLGLPPPLPARFLGLRVGLVQADLKPDQRHAAYHDDITYVTNSELGFDYLRDNLAAVRGAGGEGGTIRAIVLQK